MNQELTYTFTIGDEYAGTRIDIALAKLMQGSSSRSNIQNLIKAGDVYVNGRVNKVKRYKLMKDDFIKIVIKNLPLPEIMPEDIPIEIIFEDKDLMVVNKPKDMVVHPAVGNFSGTLVNAILHHCRGQLSTINGTIRPGIVHRIDKDTSGLLIVAKNDHTHIALAQQLSAYKVKRIYSAIVYDNFNIDVGSVEQPIARDPKNRLRMAVTANGKKAITHYRVLERFSKFTHLEVRLETGRTHQIRVHMAYIKHPILGDSLYGPKKNIFGVNSQLLHAKTLGFIHPTSGKTMEFSSDLPIEFELILKRLRGK